ncbi:MAG: hypothetical protein H6Q73_1628 [Firmicutes bacterium]|nr:hypothetical protein [Bacillota bacterium]
MRKAGLLALGLIVCISMMAYYFDKASMLYQNNQGDVPTEEDVDIKYNTYNELNNYIVKDYAEVLNDYFENFGNGQELRFEKCFSFILRSISKCDRKNLEKAFVVSSQDPNFKSVDASLQELYPQMTELMSLLEEMRSYYLMRNYVDDDENDAKAKELHEKIVACYYVYSPLAEKYSSSLRDVAIEREKSHLRQSNKGELLIRYYCLRALIKAEDLLRNFEDKKSTFANIREEK